MNHVTDERGPVAVTGFDQLSQVNFFDPEARSVAKRSASLGELPESLVRRGFYLDAVDLLAHLMPMRSSIWWLCLVCFRGGDQSLCEDERLALGGAAYWAVAPTEQQSRATARYSDRWEPTRPAYCSWFAVASAGDQEVGSRLWVHANPKRAARFVSAGIKLAAVNQTTPMNHLLMEYYSLGQEVFSGKLGWPNGLTA